jgi:hypothetical protein
MKVLFLDFDGVINSMAWLKEEKPPGPKVTGFRQQWQLACETSFDPAAVGRVQNIINATGCCLVISSSWRKEYSLTTLDRMLRHRGLFDHYILGCTPSLKHTTPGSQRGDEIIWWMMQAGVLPNERIAILDDDSDMGPLMGRLVQTDCQHGLTDADAERVIEMLI